MGCNCGSGSKKRELQNPTPKTSGAWKLTLPNGTVIFADTNIEAKALNYRKHGGKGTVEKTQ